MEITLAELARLVRGGVVGDPSTVIRGAAGIDEASEGDITFLSSPRHMTSLQRSGASAAVVHEGFNTLKLPLIRVPDPKASFAKIAALFTKPGRTQPVGVHPTAVVGPDVRLGESVSVGPHAVIMDGASVGDGSVLHANVYVGFDASLGKNCRLHPGVTVLDRVTIGDRVQVHPGAVIGADGFGFDPVNGAYEKIPHLGTVWVGNDVEIGANVTIDRARFDRTVIGEGTKIDNLVHVAHNVKIGPHCLLVAQTGLAGSVHVGKGVTLAGQSGVERHVRIGDGARVAGKAGVTRDVPEGTTVAGFPAYGRARWLRAEAALRRLPSLLGRIQELSRRVEQLENGSDDD